MCIIRECNVCACACVFCIIHVEVGQKYTHTVSAYQAVGDNTGFYSFFFFFFKPTENVFRFKLLFRFEKLPPLDRLNSVFIVRVQHRSSIKKILRMICAFARACLLQFNIFITISFHSVLRVRKIMLINII